jgi:hypothetical protein
MLRASAGWVAGRDALPASVRAVFGYYADTGEFDYRSLRLKRRIDDATDAMVAEAFNAVETTLGAAFGRPVEFSYDTKLVLPAELTLGYLYRRGAAPERAEALTRLAIEALIDGDMRDAINDDEFGDFELDEPVEDRRRVAELAQATLQERVEAAFADYPDEVRAAYDRAVAVSESHQSEDERFRELMAAARGERETDPDAARDQIRAEYRDAGFGEPAAAFGPDDLDLPYFKTQYDRVGVIYDGMLGMYRAGGFPIEPAFEQSIVLAIIGAQIWLDDLDDYRDDLREGQLTPVTAEYLLADTDRAAAESVVEISERYLNRARQEATAVDSTLTGIATEYIYRSGDPSVLPR